MGDWGHLQARFADRNRPHRMLALDGGGIRGVMTLEILSELERKLAERSGRGSGFRLCDYFDYVGGTSTGAIISAGIALGMTCKELLTIYTDYGQAMFDSTFLLRRLKSLYKSEPIAQMLKEKFGEYTTLEPRPADATAGRRQLNCLLLAVTHNLSTDSPWPISSNPDAKYSDTGRSDCNLRIPLWQLVRASTAAPVYFPPEVLSWDPIDAAKSFVFVDGGMTPYNNPAFLLFRMATQPAYRLGWPTGEDKLLLVSIGTGAAANAGEGGSEAHRNLFSNLAQIPGGLMYAAQVDQDINCRTVGRCTWGAVFDRELGDMVPRDADGSVIPLSRNLGRAFLYARYNAELTKEGLEALGLRGIDPGAVQKLDAVENIDALRAIGRAVAREVSLDHFGSLA